MDNHMFPIRYLVAVLFLTTITSPLFAEPATAEAPATDDFQTEDGFESLFNGRDLTGWGVRPTTERQKKQAARWKKNDPNAPPWPVFTDAKTFEGKTSTDDGRYVVKDGNLVVTAPAEGRRIQQFYTVREFPNDFVLRLQFRAAHNADSGVFLRGKQLQCRDFPTAGPYKDLKKFREQDWNDLEIKVTGNTAHCTCNGEVLETEFKINETGPIGLEGDRGQLEYRRIRIKTTP